MSCDDYEITDENGKSVKACITASLGRFVHAGHERRDGSPRWRRSAWVGQGLRRSSGLSAQGLVGRRQDIDGSDVGRSRAGAGELRIPDGDVDMSASRGRSGLSAARACGAGTSARRLRDRNRARAPPLEADARAASASRCRARDRRASRRARKSRAGVARRRHGAISRSPTSSVSTPGASTAV